MLLKVQTEVKRTEAAEEKATLVLDESINKWSRLNAKAAQQSLSEAQAAWYAKQADAAEIKYLDVKVAARDAEIAALHAQLAESRAENDLLQLHWERDVRALDRATDLAIDCDARAAANLQEWQEAAAALETQSGSS